MLKWLVCLCLCAHLSSQAHAATYSAKIIDYASKKDNTPQEILTGNIANVVRELEKVSGNDIVIYPEYAITGLDVFSHRNISAYAVLIPEVDERKVLCENFADVAKILTDVSCVMTLPNAPKYVVLNLLERADKDAIYNTNVVFNNKGALVAKYRKINLNEETEKGHLTAGKNVVTFNALDIGVTFGLITSDDILHKTPAQDIFKEINVTDVIITSAWRSELPFYTTLGLHNGYAKKNGINLLAASFSDPASGRGGTGVYSPKAKEQVYVPHVPATQAKSVVVDLLSRREPQLACNPKMNPRFGVGSLPSIESFQTRIVADVQTYTMKPILKTENNYMFSEEICKGKLCCKFDIKYNANIFDITPVYKVAVSNHACGLIACDHADDPMLCGSRHDELSMVMFNNISISAKWSGKEAYQYLPVSSTTHLTNIDYTFCDNHDAVVLSANSQSDVVYFGLIVPGNSAGQTLASFGFLGMIAIIMALHNLM